MALIGLAACTSDSGVARMRLAPLPSEPYAMDADEVCATFPTATAPRDRQLDPDGDLLFPGLLRGGNEAAPAAARYLFHTHGMGLTNRCEFANQLFDHLIAKGYARDPQRPSIDWTSTPTRRHAILGEGLDCPTTVAGPPCEFTGFGEYRIDNLVAPDGGRLAVWTYYWHASLWSVQEPYVRADMALSPGALALPVKRDVIDGGLGDAAAYLGEMGPILREGMGETVCLMLRNIAAATTPHPGPTGLRDCLTDQERVDAPTASLNFLSHSLGSRMLFDVLGGEFGADNALRVGGPEGDADEEAAFRLLREAETTFFMAANQLPLLGPGRVRRNGPRPLIDDPCEALPAFLRARCGSGATAVAAGERTGTLHVVGFTDPGDLLGFRLNGGVRPDAYGDRLRFTVVEHRNAPQIAWLGTWPTSAHDQELQRPTASALILCGGVVTARRDRQRILPRHC